MAAHFHSNIGGNIRGSNIVHCKAHKVHKAVEIALRLWTKHLVYTVQLFVLHIVVCANSFTTSSGLLDLWKIPITFSMLAPSGPLSNTCRQALDLSRKLKQNWGMGGQSWPHTQAVGGGEKAAWYYIVIAHTCINISGIFTAKLSVYCS